MTNLDVNTAATIIQKNIRKFLVYKRMQKVKETYQSFLTDLNVDNIYLNDLSSLIWKPNNVPFQELESLKSDFNNLCIETLWLQEAIISRKNFLYFKNQI